MEKLNNNTLALQELLTKVNNLPEGGSSGGGGASVETCTVNITLSSGYIDAYTACVYRNGQYSADFLTSQAEGRLPPFTIENVLCNSVLSIAHYGNEPTANITGNCVESSRSINKYAVQKCFLLSATPGEVITIELYDND